MNKSIVALCVGVCCSTSLWTGTSPGTLPYKNSQLPIEQRVEDLLGRMPLEEKVFQLCALRLGEGDEIFQSSGNYTMEEVQKAIGERGIGHISCPTTDKGAERSVKISNAIQKVAVEKTRLGIPVFINDEALHGSKVAGSTSYPQSIALSSTWDPELMEKVSDAIGQETHSKGIHMVLSPTLDLARDPRHGRMEETYGEDPYLASRFGVAFIKGLQKNGVLCAPKHFVANFVGEGGRDSGNIPFSERELRELHMMPYEAAVKEAGVKSMMAAYNAIDGVSCSANYWLLTEVLRNDWGFNGFVVSDWSGVNHLREAHRAAETWEDAAVMCAKAGLDVDLPRVRSFAMLPQAVQKGKITEEEIETNVRRILRAKFEAGLFEHPYIEEKDTKKLEDAPQFRALARQAAEKSIILLKNNRNVLPLSYKKIAVIGPNADVCQLGGYSATGVKGVSPLEGIRNAFGKQAVISYAKGCKLTGTDKSGFAEAKKIASLADVCVLVMGGEWLTTGGETMDRSDLSLMGVQEELIQEIAQIGKPVVVVLVDGRPVTMQKWVDKVDGIVMMFFAGEEGGNALADVLSGRVNPSGKLTVTFPLQTGDLPMCLYHRPYGREGRHVEYGNLPASRYVYQFPFGYGLSYTTYQYKNLKLAKKNLAKGEEVRFSVDITNTGKVDGEEIVQVYLTDLFCRISQSEKKLKAFRKVSVPAGETKTVHFTLPASDLAFLNEKLEPEVETGEFAVFVGTNSQEGLTDKFRVE